MALEGNRYECRVVFTAAKGMMKNQTIVVRSRDFAEATREAISTLRRLERVHIGIVNVCVKMLEG